jgi:threonylcarbamoyladenosine tRNA methylthiotransferase MtaB
VVEEIGRLVASGHREIVLTGIHLGHYGREAGEGWNLARLVRRVVGLAGEFRVRLSSLEAVEVTPELIEVMAENPERICPHLHISMQSGSNTVLHRMRRRWPAERFLDRCREVQAALDRPALTTDVIVGFPGETDAEFAETCRAVEAVGFSKLHIFRFSPREGTPAADMADRVSGQVQQRRAAELAEIGGRLRQHYFQGLVGTSLQVLLESVVADRPGVFLGTSDRYAPVEVSGAAGQLGRLVSVVARNAVEDRIIGEIRLGETGENPA